MSERSVIKIIGIGDAVKRSAELGGADRLSLGRDASKEMIDEAVSGADMLWIAADVTDSKLVAEIGREASSALTIALLKGSPDPDTLSLFEADVDAYSFVSSDDELDDACAAAGAISELMNGSGTVSIAMDDAKHIFRRAGRILIGTGEGKDLADAAHSVLGIISQHKDLAPAARVLCRIDTDSDVTIMDVQNAIGIISEASDPEAMTLWGHVADPDLHGRVKMVIAVGFKPIS